jgi:hypothetical protein
MTVSRSACTDGVLLALNGSFAMEHTPYSGVFLRGIHDERVAMEYYTYRFFGGDWRACEKAWEPGAFKDVNHPSLATENFEKLLIIEREDIADEDLVKARLLCPLPPELKNWP